MKKIIAFFLSSVVSVYGEANHTVYNVKKNEVIAGQKTDRFLPFCLVTELNLREEEVRSTVTAQKLLADFPENALQPFVSVENRPVNEVLPAVFEQLRSTYILTRHDGQPSSELVVVELGSIHQVDDHVIASIESAQLHRITNRQPLYVWEREDGEADSRQDYGLCQWFSGAIWCCMNACMEQYNYRVAIDLMSGNPIIEWHLSGSSAIASIQSVRILADRYLRQMQNVPYRLVGLNLETGTAYVRVRMPSLYNLRSRLGVFRITEMTPLSGPSDECSTEGGESSF